MKDKKDKLVVDKYTQPIYVPNVLYVCKNYTKEDLDKLFEYEDKTSIFVDDGIGFTCYGVVEKKTGNFCTVVLITDTWIRTLKKNLIEAVSVCGHEAYHVADRILEYSNVALTNGSEETFAFMTGWATKCIFTTLRK